MRRRANIRFNRLLCWVLLGVVPGVLVSIVYAEELKPYMPSPGDSNFVHPPVRESNQTETRRRQPAPARRHTRNTPTHTRFAAESMHAQLDAILAAREQVARSEEHERVFTEQIKKRRDALATAFKSQSYEFDVDCPLVFEPALQDVRRPYALLRIDCLRAEASRTLPIRYYYDQRPDGAPYLRELKQRREFVGRLRLVQIELQDSWNVYWRWQPERLEYADPFLDWLQKRYPENKENMFLNESVVLGHKVALLNLLEKLSTDGEYLRRRSLVDDFDAVLPGGTSIPFDATCPLQMEHIQREEASNLIQTRLRITCLNDERLRQVRLLLPSDSEVLPRLRQYRPGQNLQADLKFREISVHDHQYHLHWDTIINIRPDRA
ncbi:MAG: hypothetical protein KDK27_19390, partial [Leptospiraceae bacterium]|nr:hypothetical protein [Leptospiraceae bacterium]